MKRPVDSVMDPTELSLGDLYAQALLDSMPQDAQAMDAAEELEGLVAALDPVPGAQTLLAGAMLARSERTAMLQRVFSGRVSPRLEAFLAVLDRHNRLSVLRAAARSFRKLLNVRQGKLEVTLTTAVPLEESQKAALCEELGRSLGAQPLLRAWVDEEILGGAVLRIGDRVYDASIRAQLRRIKKLIAAKRGELRHQE